MKDALLSCLKDHLMKLIYANNINSTEIGIENEGISSMLSKFLAVSRMSISC
jgi:hypothetical protein